jgi:hypothetical protein
MTRGVKPRRVSRNSYLRLGTRRNYSLPFHDDDRGPDWISALSIDQGAADDR